MIELKGSYCYEGVKGSQKVVYSVKFDDASKALEHLKTKFDEEQIVRDFWYGYHINKVNKVAKDEKTAQKAYDKAEEILDGDFPDMTFERGIDKVKSITTQQKELLVMFKGLSKVQIAEKLKISLNELEELVKG